MSLVSYFAQQYNIHLAFPSLPCIVFKGGKAMVPMELVKLSANHSMSVCAYCRPLLPRD